MILLGERKMVNFDGFIDLVANDLFRIVDIERNVDVVRVFMFFASSLSFTHNWFGLLFLF